jgi:hypothetical protein
MPESWQTTLDFLRPPRRRDEPFWEWRRRPPQPVVFRPTTRMNDDVVHLHLQHPFVQRILQRFRSQGFSAHDLSRVTVLRNRHDSLVRVIAFGRLSLFGAGATRLHDRLVSVGAQWTEGKPLKPFADKADRKAIDQLESILRESPTLDGLSATVQEKLRESAASDFAQLWKHIEQEAEDARAEAERKLSARGHEEAEAMRQLLLTQRASIETELKTPKQLELVLREGSELEREQAQQEKRAMEDRLPAIDRELESEPEAIRQLYRVELRRLEPVGLVYLWPETRG